MALKTRINPIEREVDVWLDNLLGPRAQAQHLADVAGEMIRDARDTNRTILGRLPRETITVNGRQGVPLNAVSPGGAIVAEWEIFNEALIWIAQQLELHSPVGGRDSRHPGLYRRSHTLFADGVEIQPAAVLPPADEFVFINLTPYARKIELGSSSQAPDGVFQVVAVLAARRFGNIASIRFSYRTAMEGVILGGREGDVSANRQPAIVVRVR